MTVRHHFKALYRKKIKPHDLEIFFNNIGLYERIGVRNLYADKTQERTFYIDENEIEKVCLMATLKFGVPFDFNRIESVKLNPDIYKMHCNSYTDYLACNIAHNRTPEMKELTRIRKELADSQKLINQPFAKNISNLDIDYSDKKIVSVDFEFRSTSFHISNCFEFGVAIKENDQIKYEHYLFEETYKSKGRVSRKLQNMFRFGETKIISYTQAKEILENHFKDADFLLFHNMSSELKIFNTNDINFNKDKVQVIDTEQLQVNFESEKNDKKRLIDLLKLHDLDHISLHNSGNDAAYTLQLFLKMKANYNNEMQLVKKRGFSSGLSI